MAAPENDTCHARSLTSAPASLSPPGKNPPIQLSPANGIKGKRGRQSSTPAGEEANDSLREFMLIDARESVQENAEQAMGKMERKNTKA
jgi:hypothetical protein